MKTDLHRLTSLEIAEVTVKLHKDVLKAISKMEDALSGRNHNIISHAFDGVAD